MTPNALTKLQPAFAERSKLLSILLKIKIYFNFSTNDCDIEQAINWKTL